VERVIDSARESGLAGIYLLTTTAEGYFPSFGFTRVERETVAAAVTESVEFADACPASAAVLYLALA
jgi:amino-acid N-acetyltransferase